MSAESGDVEVYGTLVSNLQTDVTISGNNINGTLKFIEGGLAPSGYLAGDGYFLALKLTATWGNYTSVKVGLVPSQESGMVEILNDPDHNLVAKITDTSQKFKVVSTDGTHTVERTYSLYGLELEEA